MAHTIHQPGTPLEDQAQPSTVLTPKNHSGIIDGKPTRVSSPLAQRDAVLHSQNGGLTMPTSTSHKTSSSSAEARHSTINVTTSENLNASFQLSALDELPKQLDNFRLGNKFSNSRPDVLESQDRVLGLESSNSCKDTGLGTTPDINNKRLSNSRPVAEDVGTMQERFQILQQNCERTMQQLFQKEEENLKLKNEVTKHNEMELRLKRECERLRAHLLETEDRYTHEALEAEEREEQLTKSLTVLKEQMISSSADVLNSRSSAMKQVESLRCQLNSMMEERDDALQKLADADETASSYSTSLANLQMVLEQFQDERQSHQMVELDKCRRDLEKERFISEQLHEKIDVMQVKLDELSLAPATVKKLKEQLTESERQMAALQDQVEAQKAELLETKANLERFSAVSEDKIDRPLVKNLLMGFIHTPPAKRDEAFRVVGHIVGFTDDELKEIVVSSSGSWTSGVFHRNSTSAVHPGSEGRSKIMDRSFSELFVQFLEKESSPLPSAKLPAERMVQEQQEKLNRSSSLSFDQPSTPQPLLPPPLSSNQLSTAALSQSIPVFQMHQSTYIQPVPPDEQTVTPSTHTETPRTEIPIDQSVASPSDI